MTEFQLNQIPSHEGRVAIVTGANNGLGYETTLELCKKGFKVIMACRNLEKAGEAHARILKKVPQAKIEIEHLDLSKLNSVKEFGESVTAKYPKLDLLINNAGIMMPPYQQTEDGFESQMATNYFGHFLLTGLLLSILEQEGGGRVVTLSSMAHRWEDINFEDINSRKKYNARKAYGRSKLACLMFAYELQRRLRENGYRTISLAAHPGVSMTNLGNNLPEIALKVGKLLAPLLLQKPKDGAGPTLRAALDPAVKGGEYFGPGGFRQIKGKPVRVDSNSISKNPEKAKKLWSISEKLTGISYL